MVESAVKQTIMFEEEKDGVTCMEIKGTFEKIFHVVQLPRTVVALELYRSTIEILNYVQNC